MTPTGPCFIAGPRGHFSFEPSFSSKQSTTLLGAIGGFFDKSVVFDADGRQWKAKGIESPYKKSWWTLLLANTFYNPCVTITVLWREPKTYRFDDLKTAYSRAVDQDDDILTQFVEAEELKKRISEARSFVELTHVYRWMETDNSYEDPA